MTTESILTILALVIVAAVAVVAWRLRKKKDGPASSPAQATQPSAAPVQPGPALAGRRAGRLRRRLVMSGGRSATGGPA